MGTVFAINNSYSFTNVAVEEIRDIIGGLPEVLSFQNQTESVATVNKLVSILFLRKVLI